MNTNLQTALESRVRQRLVDDVNAVVNRFHSDLNNFARHLEIELSGSKHYLGDVLDAVREAEIERRMPRAMEQFIAKLIQDRG